MRCIERLAILCAAALFLAAPGFADDKNPRSSDNSANPAANTPASDSSAKPAASSQPATSSELSVTAAAAAPATAAASPASAAPVPPPPQASDQSDYSEPRFIPMPAVDGNPGL
ncbi:MAG: hypothetical protein WA886_07855, partial [Candidatus Acidiferrales bacterium]